MPAKKTTKAKKKMPNKASSKKVSTKKASKVSKTVAKKKTSPKSKATLANNKSKIAPYKLRKNEKYMSAVMERALKRRDAKNF